MEKHLLDMQEDLHTPSSSSLANPSVQRYESAGSSEQDIAPTMAKLNLSNSAEQRLLEVKS
jgi:hypothetical protein